MFFRFLEWFLSQGDKIARAWIDMHLAFTNYRWHRSARHLPNYRALVDAKTARDNRTSQIRASAVRAVEDQYNG